MRISPVLLLLPILVLSGSAAIANDDRTTSPAPAIASPVPAPLTIESLAGTYKGVVNKQDSENEQREIKKLGMDVPLELLETMNRQMADQMQLTISADGTFESSPATQKRRGKVKIDGNKLTFTTDSTDSTETTNNANGSTKVPKCAECCTFTLNVSADGKTLLRDNPANPSKLIPTYVKQ